jgi:hypothetical protein
MKKRLLAQGGGGGAGGGGGGGGVDDNLDDDENLSGMIDMKILIKGLYESFDKNIQEFGGSNNLNSFPSQYLIDPPAEILVFQFQAGVEKYLVSSAVQRCKKEQELMMKEVQETKLANQQQQQQQQQSDGMKLPIPRSHHFTSLFRRGSSQLDTSTSSPSSTHSMPSLTVEKESSSTGSAALTSFSSLFHFHHSNSTSSTSTTPLPPTQEYVATTVGISEGAGGGSTVAALTNCLLSIPRIEIKNLYELDHSTSVYLTVMINETGAKFETKSQTNRSHLIFESSENYRLPIARSLVDSSYLNIIVYYKMRLRFLPMKVGVMRISLSDLGSSSNELKELMIIDEPLQCNETVGTAKEILETQKKEDKHRQPPLLSVLIKLDSLIT